MPDHRRRLWTSTTDAVLVITGAALLLATVCLAMLSFGWPYGPDHAIMTVVGRAWREGMPPYATFIDVKGPLAYVPYLLCDWLTRGSMAGIRILDLGVIGLTLLVMYRTLAQQIDRRVAGWSALLLAGICYRVGYIESAQPDEWGSFGVAIAFLLLLGRTERIPLPSFAVLGLATGAAALVKPQFAVFGGLGILAAALWPTAASRTRSMVTLTIGALIPVVLMCAVLFAQGALNDMIDVATGSLMRAYLADRTLLPVTRDQWIVALRFPLLTSYTPWLFALAMFGIPELRRIDRRLAATILVWFVGTVALVVLQGRYFAYQWFPVLPPLSMLAGLAVGRVTTRMQETGASPVRRAVPVLVMLALVALTASFVRRAARDATGIARAVAAHTPLVTAVRASVDAPGDARAVANLATARFIETHIGAQREVGTWLYDATPLLLAQVRPTSRLFFIHPVLTRVSSVADSIMQDHAATLHRSAPSLVVIDCDAERRDGKSPPERSPWLLTELAANYEPAFASGGLRVYQRRAAVARDSSGTVAPARDRSVCAPGAH